jgi:hypothetical protein
MNDIRVVPVKPGDFVGRWQEIEPLLERAMPVNLRRFWPIDILAMMIQNQAVQGWFALEGEKLLAVMVIKIDQYPRRRCLNVFVLAGDRMSDWFTTGYRLLIEYGRNTGCDHFQVEGRRGWQKVMNLEPRGVVLVSEIEPANNDGGAMK